MHWYRRLRQWITALRLAGVDNVPWWGLVLAVWSGPVPRKVWRERLLRGCFKCDLYSTHQMPGTTKRTDLLHLCKSTHPAMLGVGCHCAVNIAALTANPHGQGCYGRDLAPDLGWPAYHHPSFRARLLAPFLFLLGK